MGAPAGHPFFGNKYTDGGYIKGTYTYAADIVKNAVDSISEISAKTNASNVSSISKPKKSYITKLIPKQGNKKIIIGGLITLATFVGGYFIITYLKNKSKSKNATLLTVELHNVGICTNCSEPLNGSTYVPESADGSHDDYIVCKKCGEKNYGQYPDENDVPS